MGTKCALLALSPAIPREDISRHEEGGAEAAQAQVQRLWPDAWRYAETGTIDDALLPEEDVLWVGTWGPTTLIAYLDVDSAFQQASSRDGRGAWLVAVHSVVDFCGYVTPSHYKGRKVEVTFDSGPEGLKAALTGPLLPFEEPYAAGEHAIEGFPYHPLELGESALLWILGTTGEAAPVDEVSAAIEPTDPWDMPMHRFEAAAPARKSWLARLLGR